MLATVPSEGLALTRSLSDAYQAVASIPALCLPSEAGVHAHHLHPEYAVVLGKAGEGGFSKVYKVANLIDKRVYAVKATTVRHAEVGAALNEAVCLRAVRSPYVERCFSSWVREDGKQFVVYIQTEFVQGITLREWMERRQELDGDAVCRIAWQLVCGVRDIHEAGIVHRDINPTNIMIREDGSVKIIDFGISMAIEDVPDKAGKGWYHARTGTYASPGQISGRSAEPADDIYSLGIVLFELLSMFKTNMERAKAISALKHGHMDERVSEYWPEMATVISTMTNQDPTKRPLASEILGAGLFGNSK